jgi:DNA repair ATPase RecN
MTRVTACAAALTLLLAISAHAQEPAPQPGPPEGRGGRAQGVRPAELAGMLDAWAIVQAQTALQLNDGQYGQFVTRLKRLQETRRRNTQMRNRLLAQIRALVAPGLTPDEAAIREKLKALRDHDEQTAAALRRDADAVDEVLDTRQQALFRLFEERIERQKLDLLMRARDRARPDAPVRPGGGGGDR